MPKFILQPVLENAIQHGIAPNGGVGSVHVTAATASEKLIVTVRDNGVGMEPGLLEAVQSNIRDANKQDGIGLSNISARIQLFFGREYGVSIFSREGEGTTVAIKMPVIRKD